MNLSYLFLILYLLGDMFYVYSSRSFYGGVVQKIQGSPIMMKPYAYVSIFLSYLFLALGWFFIVAKQVTPVTSYKDLIILAVIYGLAVYGVFNTTLYVTFTEWNAFVSVRDTMWGVGWIVTVSLLYLYVSKNRK